MDTAILVDELDKSAIELVSALFDKAFVFTAAALMKDEYSEVWHIVLGIPNLRTKSSRSDLVQIYNIIKNTNLDLTLNDIKLLDDGDITMLLLKRKFESTNGITRKIVIGSYIDGVRFPDSIVYYVK